jgi:hypothetical protein
MSSLYSVCAALLTGVSDWMILFECIRLNFNSEVPPSKTTFLSAFSVIIVQQSLLNDTGTVFFMN